VPSTPADLRGLAALFLRLGLTAFGGPAAHFALMEDEVVTRRGWLTRERFLDLVSASHLIPGPNSTELAIHIGYARAGWPGLLVAGGCFILPAMLIVWAIAVLYVRFGALPAAAGLLAGVKPVVLAVVLVALWRLARSAVTSAVTLALAVMALAGVLAGVHELILLAACAAIAWLDGRVTRGGNHWERTAAAWSPLPLASGASLGGAALGGATLGGATLGGAALGGASALGGAVAVPSLGAVFLAFAKIGSLLFGSGYVLVAFLRRDLVERLGWLTEPQVLDAIAVGQFTPGPVFTSATFVGYLVAGHAGAIAATLGIFLPAFVFVAITAPVLARWTASRDVRRCFDGLNAASLAILAAVALQLAPDALGWGAAGAWKVAAPALCLSTVWLTLRSKVNAAWFVVLGAAVGLLASRLHLT